MCFNVVKASPAPQTTRTPPSIEPQCSCYSCSNVILGVDETFMAQRDAMYITPVGPARVCAREAPLFGGKCTYWKEGGLESPMPPVLSAGGGGRGGGGGEGCGVASTGGTTATGGSAVVASEDTN